MCTHIPIDTLVRAYHPRQRLNVRININLSLAYLILPHLWGYLHYYNHVKIPSVVQNTKSIATKREIHIKIGELHHDRIKN
jgi:hypothetical protein